MNPDDQRTSCPGFLDDYGVWNNGFECPPLSGKIRICCGSESRRYCCMLESISKNFETPLTRPIERLSSTNMDTDFLLSEKKVPATILSLPLLISSLVGLVLIFILILSALLLWSRCRNRSNQKTENNPSQKTTLLVDHFPFAPSSHQFFLNDNHSPYQRNPTLSHHPTKDTINTTSTMIPSSTTSTSSSSGRTPSDIYYNDWKDFLVAGEQRMNLYPTMSSHSNELISDQHHLNYLFHGKRQQNDVIV